MKIKYKKIRCFQNATTNPISNMCTKICFDQRNFFIIFLSPASSQYRYRKHPRSSNTTPTSPASHLPAPSSNLQPLVSLIVIIRVKAFLLDLRNKMPRPRHLLSSTQRIKEFRWVISLPSSQHPHKLFVVGNHNQLKIFLLGSCFNNGTQRFTQSSFIFIVQICRRFVQGQNSTIHTKCFCQRHPYHQGRQLFLPRTASPPHVQLRISLGHYNTVIVRACPCSGSFGRVTANGSQNIEEWEN